MGHLQHIYIWSRYLLWLGENLAYLYDPACFTVKEIYGTHSLPNLYDQEMLCKLRPS